jgi:hypothetical protein
MDSNQHLLTSLLALAGNARLPPKILIKDNKINDYDTCILMENAVQEYIKSRPNFNKLLHNSNEKKIILESIVKIIKEFDSTTIQDSYSKLWSAFILNNINDVELKIIIDTILPKINNKKIKAQIESSIRTKLPNVIKTILNVTPPFVSIFRIDTMNKAEQLIHDNIQRLNITHTTKLDTFIDVFNFVTEEDISVKQFFNEISQITDAEIRNQYYNNMFISIINKLTTKVGKDIRLVSDPNLVIEHIFVQLYLYFINYETIKKIDNRVEHYLKLKSFDWFSYQLNEFSNKLHPNWNFKPRGFQLDAWQKETINAIGNKKNIFLSLPTSGGKTLLSTYAIRTHQRVCYLVPSEALAYQLTGIILASLNDIEKTGEIARNVRQETANFSFKKFPEHSDDIIIATPIEFYKLLQSKTINPVFDYIIFDEFHNIVDSKQGIYIEYILKFAGYYKIPIMCLSATIPNYQDVKVWLEKITGQEIFSVHERKRFFNQTRKIIQNNKLVTINPLEYLTNEIIKRNDFTHIGLYPKEIIALYNKIDTLPPIDEKTHSILSLDKLDQIERNIFTCLKSANNELFINKSNFNLEIESLTTYKLFLVLKELKINKLTPALVFKMDSQKCLNIYYNLLEMLKEYQELVYGSFSNVNKIIQAYFDTFEQNKKNIEPNPEKNITIEDSENKLKDALYANVKNQLEEFFSNYVSEKIDPDTINRFNTKYGSDITFDFISTQRKKHAQKELRTFNSPENLYLRNIHTPHQECRLINTGVSYDDMRKIRRRINAEINRENMLKTDKNKYTEKINYSHPFMIGIEYGILCYNTLLSPALQRTCQQLINEHSFITLTDASLAVGINYPIKTVMLLGGIDGEPIEDIDNTLAHQACGRAGRRGLDAEGYIIYAGVNIKNILIPSYTPIIRNNSDKLASILCEHDSEQFKSFVLDEIVFDTIEKIWDPISVIDFDKLANEMYLLQSKSINQTFIQDDDDDIIIKNQSNTEKSFEEIKAELILKHSIKIKVKTDSGVNNQIFVKEIKSEPLIDVTFDSWEDAADADIPCNNFSKIAESESSFM